MKRIIIILAAIVSFAFSMQAQTTCQNAQPFCTGGQSGLTFPATVNGPAAQAGPNYGCLGSQPNPAWYYLQVSQSGNLDIYIAGSASQDVDFICWGPFNSLSNVCSNLTAGNTIDCSYSSSPTETCNIVNAVAGQYYMILITNFSNMAQNIIFNQIGGSGSTNCGLVSSNQTICSGNSATLTLTNSSNLSNPTYSINPGGMTSPNPTFVVTPSVTTVYTMYVTGVNTSSATVTQTTSATVTVLPKPVVTPTVVNSTCSSLSNSVNLNVAFTPSGSPNYTVNWNPNPANFTPVNSGTASGLVPGTQNVTVTAAGGCSITASFSVGPIQAPASFSIINLANDYTLTCLNSNIILTNSVTNGVPLNYVWNSPCTNSATGSSFSFTTPCAGQVVGTSSTGCTMTQTFAITQDYSTPTVAVSPTVANVTCTNSAITFTGTSSPSVNVTLGWYQYVGTNTVQVGSGPLFNPAQPGVYWFCAQNNITGCVSCKSVQVTASIGVPQFTVTSPTNFTIGCASTSITSIQVTSVQTSPVPGTPVNYAAVPPPGTATPVYTANPNFNGLTVPGTYVVYIKDLTNSCVSSQSVSIIQNTIAPGVNYIQPLPILTCAQPSMVLNGVSNNTNTTITWTVPAIPSPSVNPTPNTTVVINPAATGATANIVILGTYTVGALDNNNKCISTKTLSVNQDVRTPKFTLSAQSNSVITCANPDVVIIPVVTPSLASALVPTFVWFAPTATVGVPGSQFNTTAAGNHTAISTSAVNGCTYSATYNVAVDLAAPALNSAPPFTLDCSGNPTVMIVPSITGTTSGFTYSWTAPPGVLISNPNGATLVANLVGTYKVLVTNTVNGCSSSINYSVTGGVLNVSFDANPSSGYAPLAVTFNNTSASSLSSSSITSQWSYGNGAVLTTSLNNAATTYTAAGSYSVVLIAQKGSCIDTAIKVVFVDVPSKIEVPNVFTPNGDKVNDIFRLNATNLTSVEATIFDRWGNKVYEVNSETGNFAWDGKNMSGKECPAGTYFYIIKATGKDDQKYEQKGNVSLYR